MSAEPEPGKRARQKVARRHAILAAAEAALGDREDVIVEEIAARAGLAKGTVYNYFPDKCSLVGAVTQRVEGRWLGDIAPRLAMAPGPQRLALLLCGLLTAAGDDSGAAAIVRRSMARHDEKPSAIARAIGVELQTGAELDAMAREEPGAALTLVLATMRAALREIVTLPRARRHARAAALVTLCLRALGAPPERALSAVDAALDELTAKPVRNRERLAVAH